MRASVAAMAHTVHIIASCTDRKRHAVPEALRLRTVSAPNIEQRARLWWKKLEHANQSPVQAVDLYAGDHWRVVQELPDIARTSGFKPVLWVASAGYGLIPATARIQPYSATFARGHEDSVVLEGQARGSSRALRQWWNALSGHEGPSPGSARSIQHVAESASDASILVVASPTYVSAMADDLLSAAERLRNPECLLIVSAPSPLLKKELVSHWIPSTAHLQANLGGSRLSLHARVARRILEDGHGRALKAGRLRAQYTELIERSDPPESYDRQRMTDEQVQEFIREAAKKGVNSWSAGLRLLRGCGWACEQSRFKKIFQVMGEGT